MTGNRNAGSNHRPRAKAAAIAPQEHDADLANSGRRDHSWHLVRATAAHQRRQPRSSRLTGCRRSHASARSSSHTGTDKITTALIGSLLAHAESLTLLPAPTQQTHSSLYLLFFDGGSRGNRGPGGSGSIIVRLSPTKYRASVAWAASMAHGDRRTTNNVAEYRGLLHGLRHAWRHGLTPLHVIGDSAIIINQQQHRRPPMSAKLRLLFLQTRALADEIGVANWAHHYRDHNKVANKAANMAMDEKRSQQTWTPSDRDLMRSVERDMVSDVSHWLDAAAEQPH